MNTVMEYSYVNHAGEGTSQRLGLGGRPRRADLTVIAGAMREVRFLSSPRSGYRISRPV